MFMWLCGAVKNFLWGRRWKSEERRKSYVVGLSCLCWLLTAVKLLLMLATFNTRKLNSHATQKCVWLIVSSLGCLRFTLQNDACAEFDTRRLFSRSSAEGGKFLCAHLKPELRMFTYKHDLWLHNKISQSCSSNNKCDVETSKPPLHTLWECTLQWSMRQYE